MYHGPFRVCFDAVLRPWCRLDEEEYRDEKNNIGDPAMMVVNPDITVFEFLSCLTRRGYGGRHSGDT